ncbi:unnamed protein product [Hymenolepis diminuta]|uniref:Tyrosine-protein phosphatase domain-containing protein n=2 Tax=Hymenolepis diminuta TaxID=6216 RepID=A0A0R3SAP8_HYMDI|nr:unnamed protein product [Hymenolepis diminuta]
MSKLISVCIIDVYVFEVAGVGRTGTYICIESLIRQLEAENQVNIRGFLEHIRQQRMKLVQTEQQYAFIHDALREYLLCPEHEISAMAFPSYVQCLRMPDANGVTGLQKQFEICTDYMPRVYEFTEARKPVNIPKNRLSRRLLPTDSRRVALPSEGGIEGASYINASVVQGYHRLHEFIVTQHPIPNSTETDFWRMVWDKNSPLVVVLSSSDSENGEFPDFWPTEAHDPREIGWLRVGFCASETVGDGLTRYEFLLSSSREDYALTCQLWRLHNWPSSTNDEVACSDLLKLQSVLISNSSSTANGSTIVVDDYGGNRAGIFVAVNFLINQFNLSGNIDIYYIVKMLHLQRTGIFQSPADLEFIYSLMEQFLMEIQQQDDSSSFLGGCNETSSSPGYANLSLFNGKSLLPPLTTSNSKCSSADGDVLPPKSTTLFPLIASVESEDEKILENDELRSTPVIVPETESALELHSLSSDATAGDSSVNPSLIGVLTPVKRPLNNGFVVKETILPHPLPPPPNQSPPAWPVDDLDGSDDPTPTTSLVIEGGESSLHLNGTVDEMTMSSSVSPMPGAPSNSAGNASRQPPPVRLPVPKRPPLTPSAIFTLIQTIKETGRRLGMSDVAVATACTIFHRMVRVLTVGEETGPFANVIGGETGVDGDSQVAQAQPATYSATNDNPLPSAIDGSIRSSLGDVDPYTMAMACISLGAKVQEEHQRLRDVIVAYYRTLHKTKRPPLEVGDDYDRLRKSLVNAELFLMRLLGYGVRTRADLPHAYLLHYLSALLHWIGKGIVHPVDSRGRNNDSFDPAEVSYANNSEVALARLPGLAWGILMDSYHAPLCVDYAPEYIAASILHLSLRIAGVEVPGNRHSDVAWWQAISDSLTRETVEQIQLKVMDIYAVDDRINAMANYRPEDDDY